MGTSLKTKARKRSRAEQITPVYQETRVSPMACPRCRRPVFKGTVDGEPRSIDQTRLSQAGELLALLAGCRTYQVVGFSGSHLFRRRPFHIEQGVPSHGRIHADHRCGFAWPVDAFDLRDLYPTYRGTECPF